MPAETEVGVMFPTLGVDVTCEYGRQPADTTPAGANVRAYEPGAERSRGGSRCGLTKYVDALVNGASPVQHLAVLVDPQAPGLNANDDTVDTAPSGYIPDPSTNNLSLRNNGRYIPAIGGGRQPNRNRPAGDPFLGNNVTIRVTLVSPGDGFTDIEYQYKQPEGAFSEVLLARTYIVGATGLNAGDWLLSSSDMTVLNSTSPPHDFDGSSVLPGSGGTYLVDFNL